MSKKVVIIGGGVSGLSTGIFLQLKGYNTEIYEKNAFAGGNLTGWYRKGCYIDNCIHWLNGSKDGNDINLLWKQVGALDSTTKLYCSDFFYISEYNNERLGLGKNIDETEKRFLEISPIDKKNIKSLFKCIRKCQCFSHKNSFSNNFKKIIALPYLIKYKNITLGQLANKFHSPLIKKLLTDYILEEYSSITLIFAYSSFICGDGNVLLDGSLNMAKRLIKRYEDLGGKIYYKKNASEIIFNDDIKKIIFDDKTNVENDCIVLATDTKIAFDKLVSNRYMPKMLKKRYINKKSYPVISSFHIAYKTEKEFAKFIPDSFVFQSNPIKIGVHIYDRIMIRNYQYGKFAPQNYCVLQIFLLQREKDFDFWASLSSDEYNKEKDRIIKEVTEQTINKFAILKDNLEFLDCWTPLTYSKYFDAYKGSYMSFGITNKFSLKKIPNKIKKIKNFYIASQWQTMFGGLPNALRQGKRCAELIECQNGSKG